MTVITSDGTQFFSNSSAEDMFTSLLILLCV